MFSGRPRLLRFGSLDTRLGMQNLPQEEDEEPNFNSRTRERYLDQRLGSNAPLDMSHSRELPPAYHRTTEEARRYSYKYEVLPRGSIRILTLYVPLCSVLDSEASDLHCSISTRSWWDESASSFDSISYVWGDEEPTEYLYCGDSHIKITPRLHAMLVRLREASTINGHVGLLCLWVDAVCINQDDPVERGHQVRTMDKIFRRASRVHVFLTDGVSSPDYQAQYYDSQWFHRRWVVQELLVSRHILVYLPTDPSDLEAYKGAVDWDALVRRASWCYSNTYIELEANALIRKFQQLRESGSTWFSMLTLLNQFQRTQCKDDKDRIFAYIGIASDVWPEDETKSSWKSEIVPPSALIKFDPDYTMSVEEIFIRFAVAVLRSSRPFEILQCAGAFRSSPSGHNWASEMKRNQHSPAQCKCKGKGKKSAASDVSAEKCNHVATAVQHLPSWVPDWRYHCLHKPLLRSRAFNAGGWRRQAEESIIVDGPRIRMRGATFGIVGRRIKLKRFDDLRPLVHIDGASLNGFPNHDLSTDRIGIRLHSGTVGAAPFATQVGDLVVLFPKARTPFILRPSTEPCFFELVGDCVIDGVMEGQFAGWALEHERDFILI
ncbi:uncharacterized protein PV09_07280 [Verruconis gallopava]|uniref:Heterokaryon incompatibility domain-containing protein n=1 Tax=Verruconis gallopava TaxID=253628 RepID=A0A0D1YK36_9PEZI|nr:uncharacterized protein PV09_07280 [Verruconis gallopava]KIW01237.1 hypothetical protein PV09_07280 [Verruconis gallopava]